MVDVTLIRPLNKGQGHSFWYLVRGRAYATVLRPSVDSTECIVAKRCVLEQQLTVKIIFNRTMREKSACIEHDYHVECDNKRLDENVKHIKNHVHYYITHDD